VISFRTKAETGTSIAILASLVLLVALGLFMLFRPKPNTVGIAAGKIRSQRELDERIAKLEKERTSTQATIDSWTWTEPIAQIGPKALNSITLFAQRNHLKLIAFRPQKTTDVNELTQLPFVISIEGAYPSVMQFVKDLETPTLKLGTGMVQVSTSDPSSDLVAATINVVAYRKLESKTSQEKPNAAKKKD
jgi:Tfp pilus assembly protein PilO